MNNLHIKILTPADSIKDAEKVRVQVFQVEQRIKTELDFDGKDNQSTHIVVYSKEKPIGTGRIRTVSTDTVKIERIAVVSEMRKQGIGKLIMDTINDYLAKTEIVNATLDSQLHAKGFYENLGYIQEGEVFEEVGIPHVVMIKKFK